MMDQPFAAPPRLIEPEDYECRRNKVVASKTSLHATLRCGPPGSASVLPQIERHRSPGGPVQDLGQAARTREQDAETDQNLRPPGQAYPGCRQRKTMRDEKQARKLCARASDRTAAWAQLTNAPVLTLFGCLRQRRAPPEGGSDQTRLKISVPLVPPNPKEFDRAERSGMRRAALGT